MVVTALMLLAFQAGASTPDAKPAPSPEKKICRREVVLGSAIAKKTCHTATEWQRQEHENIGRSDNVRWAGGACRGPAC